VQFQCRLPSKGCWSDFWVLTVSADGEVALWPDLNGDDRGNVDAADLAQLLANWG
jgi:hypothetical protein